MSRPRPWLYALSGAVASAAVIGVIAYTTNALSGPDDGSGSLGAGQGPTARTPARRSPPRPPPTPRPRRPRPRPRATDRHRRRQGVRRLLRRRQRRRQAGALPRVAPRAAPADRRPRRQGRRRAHRGRARRDGDQPARPRLPHALARPRDARLRVVRVDRRRAHPADRAEDTGIAQTAGEHERRRGAGRRAAAGLHRPGRDREAGAGRLHDRAQGRAGRPTLLGVDISQADRQRRRSSGRSRWSTSPRPTRATRSPGS